MYKNVHKNRTLKYVHKIRYIFFTLKGPVLVYRKLVKQNRFINLRGCLNNVHISMVLRHPPLILGFLFHIHLSNHSVYSS